jgi:hypothetical protein
MQNDKVTLYGVWTPIQYTVELWAETDPESQEPVLKDTITCLYDTEYSLKAVKRNTILMMDGQIHMKGR